MNPLPPTDVAPHDDPDMSPGRRLRAAREARGLRLEALALMLKVPVRQLQALENDQYDAFSGPAFVRATAQTLCRHLDLDPAPVLAGLPQAVSSVAVRASTSVPLAAHALPRRVSPRSGLSRRVMGLAALMLLISVVLIWWPEPQADPEEPPALTSSPASTAEAFVPPASAGASDAPATAPVAPASGALTTSASTSAPTSAPTWVPSTPVATGPPNAQPTASALASAGQAPGLRVAASGETWLEVRDARGLVLVNRLLQAGEVQSVDAPAPLQVVIGRAAVAQVTRAGQPVDLSPHTRGSIARFEVLP